MKEGHPNLHLGLYNPHHLRRGQLETGQGRALRRGAFLPLSEVPLPLTLAAHPRACSHADAPGQHAVLPGLGGPKHPLPTVAHQCR